MIWGAVKRTAISEWIAVGVVLLFGFCLSFWVPESTEIPPALWLGVGLPAALTAYQVLFVRRRR